MHTRCTEDAHKMHTRCTQDATMISDEVLLRKKITKPESNSVFVKRQNYFNEIHEICACFSLSFNVGMVRQYCCST